MNDLKNLLENNKAWASRVLAKQSDFFEKLSQQQSPEYLWIGCSDSRVPANQIVGLMPGEVFVHRNVANVVAYGDLNCLSVIQFAVDVLKVKHIIVCGHYGCGGVRAALHDEKVGLCDQWLRHVQDVRDKHETLVRQGSNEEQWDRLCELNVIEQVLNVSQTSVAQDAWKRGQELSIHGWIYRLTDGLLHDLHLCISNIEEAEPEYKKAIEWVKGE